MVGNKERFLRRGTTMENDLRNSSDFGVCLFCAQASERGDWVGVLHHGYGAHRCAWRHTHGREFGKLLQDTTLVSIATIRR